MRSGERCDRCATEQALDALETQAQPRCGRSWRLNAVRLDEAVELVDRAVEHPRFANLDAAEVAMFWVWAARRGSITLGLDRVTPRGGPAVEWFGRAYAMATDDDPNRPDYANKPCDGAD
jgi:hypothetical protein